MSLSNKWDREQKQEERSRKNAIKERRKNRLSRKKQKGFASREMVKNSDRGGEQYSIFVDMND